ncbi:MAG: hypothetical protein IT450_01605 [Phycisphaerales bacterium]|nr:hypothetical protein [Phycisphaerales bacterium]
MGPQALVDTEIERGRRLIQAMDERGIGVSMALWLYHEESSEYWLTIAGKFVDELGKHEAYLRIARILTETGLGEELPLRRVQVVFPDEPLVRSIRKLVKTPAKGLVGFRLSRSHVNGIAISDGYVYRAA